MSALIQEEDRGQGGFSGQFYLRYAKSLPGLYWAFPILFVAIILDTFMANGFRLFVALRMETTPSSSGLFEWCKAHVQALTPAGFVWFLFWLTLVGVFFRATAWFGTLVFLSNGGRTLHNNMVKGLGRVPVQFYDQNPSGRILKRFSSDYLHLRNDIPNYMNDIIVSIIELTWVVVLVAIQAPLAAVAAFPCGLLYHRVQSLFRPASRELQRLVSIKESPVWTLFSESVTGFQVLRAYGKTENFQNHLKDLWAVSLRISLLQSRITRWLNLRLKLISELFGWAVTLFLCVACSQGSLSVASAGFLMSLTIGLDVTMQWLTRTFSLLESLMVSLERVQEYGTLPDENVGRKTSSAWVAHPGVQDIVFSEFSARYREDLPLVVQNLSVRIRTGSRVGIIGPTGAGKSSIFQALFQMLWVESGSLSYGAGAGQNVDLTSEPLEKVRSLFTIVPQEPLLFSGTLRQNLDRFGKHTEAKILATLETAGLGALLQKLPLGLDTVLLEKGSNFSLGERQLFCLTRAALTGAPVVLLDEPTSSVDPTTDELVEKSSRILFEGRTQIVIAHRLSTVLTCDELLLVEKGNSVAFGPPQQVIDTYLSRKLLAHQDQKEGPIDDLLV